VSVCYPPDTLTPGFDRENLTVPAETAAVSAKIKPVPAERVARALVAGIERNRRSITADPSSALLARATSLVAPIARGTMRRAVRAIR
jgi:3-dehydrosphinganine reductase